VAATSATEVDARAVLAEAGIAYTSVDALAPSTWSAPFSVDTADGRVVLRIGPHGSDFAKDAIAARWSSDAMPVPPVLAQGRWRGLHYAITAWVRGTPLDDAPRSDALTGALADMLTAKAAAEPAGSGWGGIEPDGCAAQESWRDHLLWVTRDQPDSRTHGWESRLRADADRAAVFDRHASALARVAVDDVPRGVIHGDLLNRNVHVDGGRITGVFDWGCAAYGDPLYDLAWFEYMAPHHPEVDAPALVGAALGDSPARYARRRLLACHLHIGVDHLGFNAAHGRWDAFALVAARTEELLANYADVAD
jgi:hygromycin-B 4-O-kinase